VESSDVRTIVLTGDREPFPVVFEMGGFTVTLPPGGSLRFVVSGPTSAAFTIGYGGARGVSVYRDDALVVDVYDAEGQLLDIPGFA
jgi:hypothetical protein